MNPKTIKKQFEKSLETYNQNAVVQKIMAQILVNEILKISTKFNNILELGCGAGLLTEQISKNIKFDKFFANDLVEKSEKYIKSIIPDAIFYCGDARKIKPTQKMDLIISNAMFQWFNSLEKALQIYKPMLNNNGILAFTSFTPENYKEIKDLTGLTLEYKTLEETKEIVNKDFEILHSESFEHTMHFKTPLEILAHMKFTGVNSLTAKHWTFKEVKDFCDKYREKYPQNTLTYAGMILICKKV